MVRKMTAIHHIHHFPRYREVANILIKHGFGFIFDRFTLAKLSGGRIFKKVDTEIRSFNLGKRLRFALEELGPTYIKLGQLLSTRADLLSPEIITELEKLQNDVPPFPYEDIIQIFIREGIELERDFSYVNPQPIAAASIAQVHEAYLKSGERVVVKVQRPGIQNLIETDLEIISELSKLLEKRNSWARLYKISEIVDELGEALINELDFTKEARNADIFYNNHKNDEKVVVPQVYWDFSSKRVLTLEYIEGVKISDFVSLKKQEYSTAKIATNLVEALFKQIYEYGFFHADPHPGNIAITSGEKIIFYDFGQVGVVDDVTRDQYMNLLISMMRYDTNGVTRALLDMGIGSQHVNQQEFRRDVSRLQQKYYGLPLSEINVGESLGELVDLSIKYQMRMPSEFSLIVKMMMTVENIISQLDPQLSIIDIAEPYGKKVLKKKLSPRKLKNELADMVLDYADIARTMPGQVNNILRTIEEGELKVKMEHMNMKRLFARIDIMSNRLSLAIILASIIIGTSLIADKSSSNFLSQFPLAEGGFVLGVILGLFLAYSILKSGRY